jgi:hypothetical protein
VLILRGVCTLFRCLVLIFHGDFFMDDFDALCLVMTLKTLLNNTKQGNSSIINDKKVHEQSSTINQEASKISN